MTGASRDSGHDSFRTQNGARHTERDWHLTIRADGSGSIGLGHVVRCLALANSVERRGGTAGFVCRRLDGVAAEFLRLRSAAVSELPNGIEEEEDARRTLAIARAGRADVVLVDHYGLGPSWWRSVRAELPVAVVDDVGRSGLTDGVALVVNQNAGAEEGWYDGVPRILCGLRFALLRGEFFEHRKKLEERRAEGTAAHRAAAGGTKRLVVTLGGSDPNDVTSQVLRALRDVPRDVAIDVILGPGFRHLGSVLRRAELDSRIWLYEQPSDLPELMARADLAVTGGGSTLYECAYLGLPALAIQTADNQAGTCRAMAAAGAVRCLGPWDAVEDEEIGREADLLLGDEGRCEQMAVSGMALVDGHGARRVAEALASVAAQPAES